MPVRNRRIPNSLESLASDVSPTLKLKSPIQKAVRRSARNSNGNQLKISKMFQSKRCRSPDEAELYLKKKKSDNNGITEAETSKKPSVVSSKNTENEASTHEKNKLNKSSSNIGKDSLKSDKSLGDSMSHTCDISTGIKKVNEKDKTTVRDTKNDEDTDSTSTNNDHDSNIDKCDLCQQFLSNSDLMFYEGHPQQAVEEYIALTSQKLVLVSGDDRHIMERPHTNITGFSIFDKKGHLCAIDSSLVENDTQIYMSGYLRSICSDSANIDEDSVPVKDVGPIIEWYIHGFDGGNRNCITLSTEFGEYNLLKPSNQYKPLMDNLYEKICLCKVVVEYLEEYYYLQPSYEDLLEVIRGFTIPQLDGIRMSEEMLHKHANFVCEQVVTLEAGEDEEPLITLPCMRELVDLMGIKLGKHKARTKIKFKKVNKKAWTKATTTPLVRKTFESFFSNQLDKTNHELVLRRRRCGVCEACQLSDCGECNACRAMAKFGGQARTKKACVRRFCPNMAVDQAGDSDTDDEADYRQISDKKHDKIEDVMHVKLAGANNRKIKWISDAVKADKTKVFYEKVEIDGSELCNGDYVMVETSLPSIPALVARIVYMWKEPLNPKEGYFHGEVFIRASDTVLGEVGDPREVFLCDSCCHGAPLTSVLRKASVEKRDIPPDWFKLGGKEVDEKTFEDDGKTYFYSKYYERFTARFKDIPENPTCRNELRKHRFCPSCERKTIKDSKNIPVVSGQLAEKSAIVTEVNRTEWTLVKWQGYDYKKGGGVFLKPGTFRLKSSFSSARNSQKIKLKKVDEDIYTEYYRKSNSNLRGSNIDTGEPFCVGYIAAVTAIGDGPLIVPQDIFIKVNVLYRPENTKNRFPQQEDVNVVYWSDEIREIPFAAVMGPCHLIYKENVPVLESLHDWLEGDPNRIYFSMAYDKSTDQTINVPNYAKCVGGADGGTVKGKGKGKGKSSKPNETGAIKPDDFKVRPLRTLDVFAGCGGLSEGLHRAGAADCRWAVENLEAAAHAYSLNNKGCSVFIEDCNALLAAVMAGQSHSSAGLRLPMRGEVELLCGGPPCQGFSGMNRFNSRDYSNFKNSLVASYLSYCDFYRPKYFILENVRNFVAFKRGMVLKLTMRALLDMGYQCTFGILQAGNYGVPQTRQRLIILAAAPGQSLPFYPEPTNVFSRRACSLTTMIDGKRFTTNIRWEESAPRRTCTIHDAMSDLPPICNGANRIQMEYDSMPESYFQRTVRSKDESVMLCDHICKNMAPLIMARICRVPKAPGSDWRDLPNQSVMLSDGTKCKVLQYRYDDKRNGRSASGALRGVCACATGRSCSPTDKQENTLIPWCLPHTGNRHNNWAGLYGRLSWDGYFSTTVTDPEPMGKQGRVLHPEQPRVVSVRECARSQGFPDTYMFVGSLQDKHRQIGNAVPPPLGAALGREIKKAMAATALASK